MQNRTAKLINEQRVIELLECYGADAQNWPEEERAAASALISSSADLQQRQREAEQLDELMGMPEVRESLDARPDSATVANIINALPEQPVDNTVDIDGYRAQKAKKNSAKQPNSWWTYGAVAAAAVVFLAVGIIVQQPSQSLQPSGIQPMRTAAASQEELDVWMWQDVTGQTNELSSESAQQDIDNPVTYMAMVELDWLPNDE
jgi:hypothetical protein